MMYGDMPTSAVVKSARKLLEAPLDFEGFLNKLSPKDRINAERRAATIDTEAGEPRASLWRRLTASLMTLAPVCKLVGKQTIQFYIPDGKYRMQVFALEDLQDGNITIYCPNKLAEATEAGIIKADASQPNMHTIKSAKQPIYIEPLDGNTPNPPDHVKDLVGWNRKAVKIILPQASTPEQIETAELICAIAAVGFVKSEAAK
jgi:hypothetical protein